MFRRALPLVLIVIIATAGSLAAQTTPVSTPGLGGLWVNVGGGGTNDGYNKGGAVVSGLSVQIGPLVASVTPLDLILSRGDSYPYYRDSFGNGDSVCRNSITGEFADDTDCIAVSVDYALTADLSVFVPRTPLVLGAGVRRDGNNNPWFGTIGLQGDVTPITKWTVTAHVGPDYVSGIAALSFRIRRF